MKNSPKFHLKNKHKSGSDLDALCEAYSDLLAFVFKNKYETKTIGFANPKTIKTLNTGFLFKYYHIKFWKFLDTNLCPPISGRVDYIHHIADLLKSSNVSSKIKSKFYAQLVMFYI
ncbi:RlmF-related methyltransferase [Flaviramulus aquimarinus]|uniref:RlmF-related methyltransferase n=1 Tax=Flaviramulus aquimarinus TaxID=1170456 RepID=UPI003CD09718